MWLILLLLSYKYIENIIGNTLKINLNINQIEMVEL